MIFMEKFESSINRKRLLGGVRKMFWSWLFDYPKKISEMIQFHWVLLQKGCSTPPTRRFSWANNLKPCEFWPPHWTPCSLLLHFPRRCCFHFQKLSSLTEPLTDWPIDPIIPGSSFVKLRRSIATACCKTYLPTPLSSMAVWIWVFLVPRLEGVGQDVGFDQRKWYDIINIWKPWNVKDPENY